MSKLKKYCDEHIPLVEKVAELKGKIDILIALNLATLGLIGVLIGTLLNALGKL